MEKFLKILQLFFSLFGTKKAKAKAKAKETPKPEKVAKKIAAAIVLPKKVHWQKYLWCLDNGHGKLQAGKRSAFFQDEKGEDVQFLEWEFNRDIVQRIVVKLKDLGIAYYIVAPDSHLLDSALRLRVERTKKVTTKLMKVFVSIHANAARRGKGNSWASPTGIEVLYRNDEVSEKLAKEFSRQIAEKTGFKEREIINNSRRGIFVLKNKNINCPAILTENGFFTNKEQCKELMKDEVRQKIADAHVEAILEIEGYGAIKNV